MRTVLVLVGVLVLANAGWAAETDLENSSYRELPLQRGPISGGKQRQPTQSEINERAQVRGRTAEEQKRASDDLYQRVLKQSQQSTPRTIDTSK